MTTQFSSGTPHNAAFVVYINGIEVPAIRVSRRYGVWQIPELQVSMVPDPVLTRLGREDRVQIQVFYLDDTSVDPSVVPAFRLYFDGEITGWGYQSTSSGRVITFTAVNQVAIFTQLFVQFLTTFDDLLGHATLPGTDATGVGIPSSQIVFPFALFKQGLIPTITSTSAGTTEGLIQDPSNITRPFDFLYNVVRNMIGAQVPKEQQTIPAANFFSRWSRLTNFHNRFVASPFFDEFDDNPHIFPVLKALQNVSAIDTIANNLIPNVQNAGSLWDMIQLVFGTMLMEIAMIPSMPLVTVALASSHIQPTDFAEHKLVNSFGSWVPALSVDSRKTSPKRIPNYFPKPQMLFGIPPTCNVVFPSQLKTLQYEESYATQPTRLYFNDETLLNLLKIHDKGYAATVHNALTIAYPPEADAAMHARLESGAKFNGKNLLIWPEEFFKGPVLDRRDVPSWLFFLKQNEVKNGQPSGVTADGQPAPLPPPARTPATRPPVPTTSTATIPPGAMHLITGNVGTAKPDGTRQFNGAVESLRPKIDSLGLSIPTDFLLAWVAHESGGKLSDLTTLNERGYFQIMGPHVERVHNKDGSTTLKTVTLADSEAIHAGLGLDATGTGAGTPNSLPTDSGLLSTNADFSLRAGIKLVQYYRALADGNANHFQLPWTEGDMWRLTKLEHNGSGSTVQFLKLAQQQLGHPPVSWEEFYKVINGQVSANILDNATVVGGIVPSATGTMVIPGDKQAYTAPAARAAPRAPVDVAAAPASSPTVTSDAQTVATNTQAAAALPEEETVYQLYAKFEFFRERYARRSGSAQLAWNPYIVPGFPATIFDHRSSRVDLACYITTVQDNIDATGQKSTAISFLYGRQLQEMFELLATQFASGEASAGAAPAEPVRDVRKIIQSFGQSEDYYRRMFYGAQPLFGKDAAFDFRKVIGYAPITPTASPTTIFVDGPEEADQDTFANATAQLSQLTTDRAAKASQLADLQSRQTEAQAAIAATNSTISTVGQLSDILAAQLSSLVASLADATAQLIAVQRDLAILDAKIGKALAIVQSTQDVTKTSQVTHNLVGDRELVPLPVAQPLFNSYEAAMRYAWRPICTLDEYIVFYNSAGEGKIPSFGAPGSLGAPYYQQIRRLTPATSDVLSPIGADGLGVVPTTTATQLSATEGTPDPVTQQPTTPAPTISIAPGLDQSFAQTRADWNKALIAYRTNVRNVKAPRT